MPETVETSRYAACMFDLVRWLHLIGASVWVGGLITLGALVPALRRAGAERELLQAMARQFGRVSWAAMALAVITGIIQLTRVDLGRGAATSYGRALFAKLLLVGLAAALALGHQLTARSTTPAVRGIIQGLILLSSLGILAMAVVLAGS